MHDYLLIKATSLAAEAALIRKQEHRRLKAAANARTKNKSLNAIDKHVRVYRGLNDHRRTVVRNEARWTNLARGFLRGHDYLTIERLSYQQPNWDRVEALVMTYGEGNKEDLAKRFAAWKQTALAGINSQYEPGIYPGSTRRQLSAWVLRNHTNADEWLKWRRETHPLRVKKPWVGDEAVA